MSETQAAPQLSGQMFLFEKPELISKELHGELGVSQPEQRFGFCAKIRAVPLTVSEIPAAMKDYPIVFASPEQMVPVAVTGLIDDVNLFVDENGDWEANRYIPGYLRRYPFGVAAETGGERIAIVIDTAYPGISKGGEIALFEGDEPSEMTKQAIEFCKSYEQDRHRTNDFANLIKELGVVKGQTAQYTPTGETEPRSFAEYFGIDEEAVKAFPADKLAELRDNGVLPLIYAMIMSMGNFRTVLGRRAARFQLNEKDVLNPAVN